MDIALTDLALAIGKLTGAWRLASRETRRAAGLAAIAAAWDTYLRDAGPGSVGSAHRADKLGLLTTADPRRDGLLLWLADHGVPGLRAAAAELCHAVEATRRWSAYDHGLIEAARGALATKSHRAGHIAQAIPQEHADLGAIRTLASAVDHLRMDADFRESHGHSAHFALPTGRLDHYVAADPGAAWALNLASLAQDSAVGRFLAPGLINRAVFRNADGPDAAAFAFLQSAASAISKAYERLLRIDTELKRGRRALDHLSRNARAGDAWVLVVALGSIRRRHLARVLNLSRAGADIQAHALADAGLVELDVTSGLTWTRGQSRAVSVPIEAGPLSAATAGVDAAMAEIDRLLARSTQKPEI